MRIVGVNFTAVAAVRDGVIIDADRAVGYMRGWRLERLVALAARRGWRLEPTSDDERAQLDSSAAPAQPEAD
jgi:hypothetical protein